jgi:putative glutathione S-transferase
MADVEDNSTPRGGLRVLEWIPSQKLLVGTARFTWTTLWRIMLSELAPQSPEGDYVRPAPQVGSGTSWPGRLPMVAGRYHVYIGNACPWCHRVSITLRLRGLLHGVIGCTRLADDPERASRGGWYFDATNPDPLCGAKDLKAVYDACTVGGKYEGRCTAPLLVDLETQSIISNESADIIRMLNAFDVLHEDGGNLRAASATSVDLYPPSLAPLIDETNAWTYEQINNGVYRAGFATKQAAYERAEADVHTGLARVDAVLTNSRFLCGDWVTEADVRLLPTACRFDGVYATFFRCGRKQLRSDYPHVQRWLHQMLELTGDDLFDLGLARQSYFSNIFPLNPGGIVPVGPTGTDLGFPETRASTPAPPAADEQGAFDSASLFIWRDLTRESASKQK